MSVTIVWFRQDLRLADNPALREAVDAARNNGDEIVPLYIHDSRAGTVGRIGEASGVWLHHSLHALHDSLEKAGSRLTVLKGDPISILPRLAEALNVNGVFWNRSYDPVTRERDGRVKRALEAFSPKSFLANLLFEPAHTLKADDTPYRVFTPYWKNLMDSLPGEQPLPAVRSIDSPSAAKLDKQIDRALEQRPGETGTRAADAIGERVSIDALNLVPELPWAGEMMSSWTVGEHAARRQLMAFLKTTVKHYKDERDLPAVEGTSRLSVHLHFGEISPRQIVHEVFDQRRKVSALNSGEETFVKEVVWREFAHNLIYQFPHTVDEPLDPRYEKFPWAKKYEAHLSAWQQGQTGIPIVDAGMRQLYATGWMHNRIRMVVASFLIKNLLVPWQEGERWFRHTLVDADVASNAMGWQWAAGSGADAAPFFRVFNPVLQGEKFDKEGAYVRHWVPELAEVAQKFVHKPWELPEAERNALDYPEPLVDLKVSRKAALEAFETIKKEN